MPQLSVIRMPGDVSRYDLVMAFFKLRKAIFIDKMDWPLYAYETIEFEQYDTFQAVYIIAHEGDRVLGGARLIRTDHRIGNGSIRYSYMIRDAYEGVLPGMPQKLCYDEPPSAPNVWELTRLATLPGTDVAGDILNGANDFLLTEKAKTCLFLGPPGFLRMARSMGYQPVRIGPTVRNDDGAFLAFSCDVVVREARTPELVG
ncbi:MAG: acyl-homoserine-lactone synthase [Pseudomonadota bacterium]